MIKKILVLAALVAASACGSTSPSPTSPTPTAATVVSVAVTLGDSSDEGMQLKAAALFSDGTARDVTNNAAWESSKPLLATVSSTGFVTVKKGGDVRFVATYQSIPGEFQMVVVQTKFNISGFVFPVLPNQPRFLAGVIVGIVSGPDSGRTAVSDSTGHFTFSTLRRGTVDLQITTAGYSVWRITGLQLTADQEIDAALFPIPPTNESGVRATGQCNDASWTYTQTSANACQANGGLAWGVCPGPLCNSGLTSRVSVRR